MALKALLTRKKLDAEEKRLAACRQKDAEFATRESELEKAVGELTEQSTDEERQQVEEEVEALEEEKRANEEEKGKIQAAIDQLQEILDAEEEKQPDDPDDPDGSAATGGDPADRKKGEIILSKRYADMSFVEKRAFCERDSVKKFLADVRNLRSVTGGELIVPEEVLPLLKDTINRYSKLRGVVNLVKIKGKARQTVLGNIPEAVWTEQGGKINELALNFTKIDLDGYKVAGFIPLSNWLIEDNDVDLLENVIDLLGQAIGYALDKAIVYGTGEKMPTGMVKDLQEGNKTTIAAASTGTKFFKELALAAGKAKANYAPNSRKVWVMNETTYNAIKAEAITYNAAGAVVSAVNNTMPVIGGDIVTLDFVKDNIIIGGYAGLYLLGERKEVTVDKSSHVRFIEDETVVKGTGRYDGKPVNKDAFVAIGIAGATFEADELKPASDFATDTANV